MHKTGKVRGTLKCVWVRIVLKCVWVRIVLNNACWHVSRGSNELIDNTFIAICIYKYIPQKRTRVMRMLCITGWRRLIGSPKLQIIFHKRATKYRSLLQKMTYKDEGSYESWPPCRRCCVSKKMMCIEKYCVFNKKMLCIRPRSFLETGFRPLYPSFVWFVPFSRTKRVFWISNRKPNFDWAGVDTSRRVRHPPYSKKFFVRDVA